MKKVNSILPGKVRSHWLRTLKINFVRFLILNYTITSCFYAAISPDMIEASPTTRFNLSEQPDGDVVLVADGDVAIRKFSLPGNFIVKTSGRVTFNGLGSIGGILILMPKIS